MRIEIHTDFKYPLSPSFKEKLEAMIDTRLSRMLDSRSGTILSLNIKDQVSPKNSKKRFFDCSLILDPARGEKIVVTKSSKRIPSAVKSALRVMESKLNDDQRQNRSKKRKNTFRSWRQRSVLRPLLSFVLCLPFAAQSSNWQPSESKAAAFVASSLESDCRPHAQVSTSLQTANPEIQRLQKFSCRLKNGEWENFPVFDQLTPSAYLVGKYGASVEGT